jgi:alkylhydroperoxidase family enzyme
MPLIQPVDPADTRAAIQEQVTRQITRHGRITNMKLTLLHSLPAFHALMEWYPLRDAVAAFAGERAVNWFCHAISSENECLICSTFFRKILIDGGQNPDDPVLGDTERLLVDFARHCASGARKVDSSLNARLKAAFTDEEIVLLTAFAGLMIATNLVNNALSVDLDGYLESYSRR